MGANISIFGNVGTDPKVDDKKLSFNVAVNQGWGDNQTTNWFRCTVWGKRGQGLAKVLRKGSQVFVSGEFETNEYQEKTYMNINASTVTLGRNSQKQSNNQSNDYEMPGEDPEDSIPF